MSSSKEFVPGDLVLVNFPGDGYWPSKIISQKVTTHDFKSGWRKIVCFGGNEEGGAYTKDMKPYDDQNKMKYISTKTGKSLALKKAVKQISMESQNRRIGGTEKKNLPAKEKKNQNKAKNMSKLKKKEVMDVLVEEETVEYENNANKKNTDSENTNKIVTIKVNKQTKENSEAEFHLVEDDSEDEKAATKEEKKNSNDEKVDKKKENKKTKESSSDDSGEDEKTTTKSAKKKRSDVDTDDKTDETVSAKSEKKEKKKSKKDKKENITADEGEVAIKSVKKDEKEKITADEEEVSIKSEKKSKKNKKEKKK